MSILQLIIDFGMLVLIWLVQLLIYPGFKYFGTKNLIIWHRKYTQNMGLIVGPLMLVQLGLHIYSTIFNFSLLRSFNLILVVFTWVYTFLYFVPLHQKISKGVFIRSDLIDLELNNWWRTLIWSIIFILQLILFLR